MRGLSSESILNPVPHRSVLYMLEVGEPIISLVSSGYPAKSSTFLANVVNPQARVVHNADDLEVLNF
jgi:hypothetical protein